MKKVFHKIAAIVMAFVVVVSTMSFTINMHYCGETLVETAVFQKAKGCGMEMENPSSDGCSVIKEDCCNNDQITTKGQEELQLDKITFNEKVFVASFLYSYRNLFEVLNKNRSSFKEYKPPLVIRQLYKIDETYLI